MLSVSKSSTSVISLVSKVAEPAPPTFVILLEIGLYLVPAERPAPLTGVRTSTGVSKDPVGLLPPTSELLILYS